MAINKGKVIFWLLVAGAAITGGIMIYKKLSVSAQETADTNAAQAKAAAATAANSPDAPRLQAEAKAIATTPAGFPLQMGSTDAKTGGAVSLMQQWMIAQNPAALPVYHADGQFGTETQTWVKQLINTNGTVSQDWYNANVVTNTPLDTSPPLADNTGADLLSGIIPTDTSSNFEGDGKKNRKQKNAYNGKKGRAAKVAQRFDLENNYRGGI